MDPPKVSLTLTIDTKQHKVLFAQADKAFVDFIFSLLFIPMGRSNIGCLPKIYRSVKDFKDAYMVSNLKKPLLLNLKSPVMSLSSSSLLPPSLLGSPIPTTKTFYKCDKCVTRIFLCSTWGAICPGCHLGMYTRYNVRNPTPDPLAAVGRKGFVKGGVAKYMVMDDLSVTHFDPSSTILLLKKMNAQVLLEHALSSSNSVLTNVFLGGEGGSSTTKRVKREPDITEKHREGRKDEDTGMEVFIRKRWMHGWSRGKTVIGGKSGRESLAMQFFDQSY
ncbi:hypothetical protein L6452_15466 [Arctium lappa]|uniref:Uncharacterized protein n=1 Tax=Arctium lappa TaxID=4217 RepID=A0ACB9CNS2_ARCLA|nr:hypothetical protein L6452_15466 [Arctium lappa]